MLFKRYYLAAIFIVMVLVLVPSAKAALVGDTSKATLTVSPQTGTYDVNENFSVKISVNTGGQGVVVVAAYLNYDRTRFEALSIDTTGSVFTMEAEKVIDSTNGVIKITRGIPTPGVNTTDGLVATINFKAIAATTPTADNLTFQFTPGSTLESNVILDDGKGTDYLSGVYNGRYTVSGGTGDITPPTVSMTTPASGTTVSGTVTVLANASDNVGVVGVQFKLDGANLGSEDATSPYSISWNTTTASNGAHLLTAVARDAAGNSATSAGVDVTVNNQTPPPISLTVGLTANPNSGIAPLTGVTLTASVSGTATGNINYTFYCNRSDSGTNITAPYNAKFDNQSQTTYTASGLCNYSSAGSYTAKVIVERGTPQAEARATVTVTSALPPPPSDTTPPSTSSVSASSITANSATINWTTNEASDSQVEYGPTTSYGSQTGLNTSLVTFHSVLLSNLSPSTTYHFRVKSRDVAGNLATSGDYTFTTTAASLTLSVILSASPSLGTAPLSGVDLTASVSGTATGNINYTFYCNRSDTGLNVTTPYNTKYNNISETSKTATDLCSYTSAGSYSAKVIVERGSSQAEARAAVIVNQPAAPSPRPAAPFDYAPFGYIDSADENKVIGWVYDQNTGASPVTVQIFVDKKNTASATANQERKDIVGAAKGIVKDTYHGFSYNFSDLSPGTHTISVYAVNMPGGNLVELGSSPKTVTVVSSRLSKLLTALHQSPYLIGGLIIFFLLVLLAIFRR